MIRFILGAVAALIVVHFAGWRTVETAAVEAGAAARAAYAVVETETAPLRAGGKSR